MTTFYVRHHERQFVGELLWLECWGTASSGQRPMKGGWAHHFPDIYHPGSLHDLSRATPKVWWLVTS